MKIDPNSPVTANIGCTTNGNHELSEVFSNGGMTVRAEIASRALAGLLANTENQTMTDSTLAEHAVSAADALISRLNR